jgi:hypothetical protein
MADLKLQSEKRKLKVGDNLGTLYGEGEPVQMKVTQTAIDTLERLEKEHNLDLIDDRIVCSTSPREVQMIMNFQKEKEQYANARVLEEQLKLLNKIKTKFQQYARFNPVFAEYLDDIELQLKEVKP